MPISFFCGHETFNAIYKHCKAKIKTLNTNKMNINMKTIHYFLLGLAISAFSQINGQDFKGIWISTHEINLKTINERHQLQGNEFVKTKLDSTEIDTSYSEVYMLLDFIDEKNVIVKGIGGKQKKYKYTIENGNLFFKVKGHKLKGSVSENNIFITEELSNSETGMTIFEKLNDSKITDKTGLENKSFVNSNWTVDTTTSFNHYGFDYHFMDKNIAMVNYDYGNIGYTSNGVWQIDWYKNHLFVRFRDMDELETKVYHLYDKTGDTLIGNMYEHNHFRIQPPQLKDITLIKQELLDETQFKTLETNLIGKWTATNNPLFNATSSNDLHNVDTIVNQNFEIVFNSDKTFRLEKSGTIVTQNDKIHKQDTLTGKWEISKTGKYIILNQCKKRPKYMTVNNIKSDYLEIFYKLETLYNKHTVSFETIKMRKQHAQRR